MAWLPDAATRAALALAAATWRALEPGPGVRWIAPTQAHLTLRFLGASSSLQRDGMAAGLGALAVLRRSCVARAGPAAVWPSVRAPRVLVLGLAADAGLVEVAAALETLARDCGYAAESRRFRAHVTLARVRPGTRLVAAAPTVPPFQCRVDALTLVLSTPGPDGSAYEVLARFPLSSP